MRNVRGRIDPSLAAKTAYKSAGRDMIRFIMLLPLKIIGLVFLAIGAFLDKSNRRRIEREKQAEKQRRELERISRIENARIEKEKREKARADRIAQADRRRAEKERIAADQKRAADLERKKVMQFKAEQARTDMEHYRVQRSELLKLYTELEKQYEQAATDRQKEIVFRKQIALNNQIRGVDRQIEKAQYTINKFGPE